MNLMPFIERLSIVDKNLQQHRLGSVMNWAQYRLLEEVHDQMNSKVPSRIIVLKARQMGISTIINGLQFTLAFMQHKMRGLIVAHELDASEHLLSMIQHYWETFYFSDLFTQRNKSAKHLSWRETDSRIRVSTAKNTGGGRSQTLQFLHASEVGFWENGKELMTGLSQSIPNQALTFIFMESTANGVGNYFHSQWEAAKRGDIDYKPLFFPWWKHPEYTAEYIHLPSTLPSAKDEEERVLTAALSKVMSRDEVDSRLVWRRYALKNNCQNDINILHQEYPSTDEEAFVSTGRNIFPLEKLKSCYDPQVGWRGRVDFVGNPGAMAPGTKTVFNRNSQGELTLFKLPANDCAYVVACDPTRTTHGDHAVIQVFNRYTWEQVAVWRARCDPVALGQEAVKLGLYFNNALINVEINGPGWATIGWLRNTDYPYVWFRQDPDTVSGQMKKLYGWHSSEKKKQEAVGYLVHAIVEGDIILHHQTTYTEMMNYVIGDNGTYGNADSDGFDDCVTSTALAIATMRYEAGNLAPQGTMHKTTVAQDVNAMIEEYNLSNGTMDVDEDLIMGDEGTSFYDNDDEGIYA